MDEPALHATLPHELVVEAAAARIGMVHIPGPAAGRRERLAARFPGCDAVVYGHTHVPEVERVGGVWILNPGLADRAAAGAVRGRCSSCGSRRARARADARRRSDLTDEHVFASMRTHVRQNRPHRRDRRARLERRRALVRGARRRSRWSRRASRTTRSGRSRGAHYGGDIRDAIWRIEQANHLAGRRRPRRPAARPSVAPRRHRRAARARDNRRRWTSTSSSSARRAACRRPARAGRAARPARRRAAALRLRRGHAAAADALDGRAARPRGDLHRALPRRPLPRPARDAEDVPLRQRELPLTVYGPPGLARPLRLLAPRLRQAHLPARARRGARRGRRSNATATDRRLPGAPRRRGASATRSSRTTRPGRFDVDTADALGIPNGPERGALQRGESITLDDGRVVTPDAGARRGAAGPQGRDPRRHRARRGGARARPGRRRARPRGDVLRGGARARRRHAPLDRAQAAELAREAGVRCSR